MKAHRHITEVGPFKVDSISQDPEGVRFILHAAFPRYGKDWPIKRAMGEGGGPSVFAVVEIAKTLEAFLNQPYNSDEIEEWKEMLEKAESIKEVAEALARKWRGWTDPT